LTTFFGQLHNKFFGGLPKGCKSWAPNLILSRDPFLKKLIGGVVASGILHMWMVKIVWSTLNGMLRRMWDATPFLSCSSSHPDPPPRMRFNIHPFKHVDEKWGTFSSTISKAFILLVDPPSPNSKREICSANFVFKTPLYNTTETCLRG
jgi:hypothetical protein